MNHDLFHKQKKCVPYLTPERTQYHVSNDIESTKSQISS